MNENYDILDVLTILSVILQLMNYHNDLRSVHNEDIMQELQKQDKEYFDEIIRNQKLVLENQKKIIDKLAF